MYPVAVASSATVTSAPYSYVASAGNSVASVGTVPSYTYVTLYEFTLYVTFTVISSPGIVPSTTSMSGVYPSISGLSTLYSPSYSIESSYGSAAGVPSSYTYSIFKSKKSFM